MNENLSDGGPGTSKDDLVAVVLMLHAWYSITFTRANTSPLTTKTHSLILEVPLSRVTRFWKWKAWKLIAFINTNSGAFPVWFRLPLFLLVVVHFNTWTYNRKHRPTSVQHPLSDIYRVYTTIKMFLGYIKIKKKFL